MANYKNLTYTYFGPYQGNGDNVPDKPNAASTKAVKHINPGEVLTAATINGQFTQHKEMRVREIDANGCPCGTVIVVPRFTQVALP